MKHSLKAKFVFIYIFAAAFMLTVLNALGRSLIFGRLLSRAETNLYNEASMISKQYLSNAYVSLSAILPLKRQFSSLHCATGVRIWVTEPNGEILIDSDVSNSLEGIDVNEFDKNFLLSQTARNTDVSGLLAEKSIAVIYPLTLSMETRAYIVLMQPIEELRRSCAEYADVSAICDIAALTMLLLVLLYIYYIAVTPIKSMTDAAKGYANGDFGQKKQKISGKEQADLAAAIAYMGDKMSDMNDYQKKFIANVSHDFRSPLTSIKGYAQAMLDGTVPADMQNKYLNVILFEAERLSKLTNNLLTLSGFENNGIPMDISTFDINNEIRLCSAAFERRCTERQISLELDFAEKEQYVNADKSKMELVIQNLLDNAVKFSRDNSTIEIHTAKYNQKVFVSIKDHGIGIPKESLNKIWDRFYKSDTSRGRDKSGTGLGLSITKEIIESHGEHINVISTQGAGTEFIFSLPAARQ